MRIYVGNLTYTVTDEDLRDVFGEYGELASAEVIKDKFSTMGDADYWELLESIDDFYRVHVGDLVRYARRSRNLEAILSQLIEKIGINEVTFGTLLKSVSKVTRSKDGHGKADH